MPRYSLLFPFLLLSSTPCRAADWQATAAVGFGLYHPIQFSAPAGSAEAGIGPRYALNAAAGRRIGEHFVLEAGWMFQDGDFELSSGGVKTAFDANAHAVYADMIWHPRRQLGGLRPYLEGGTGVKFYHGVESPGSRPLAQFGSFRAGVDPRPMLTFGGGLEWPLSSHWALRLDIRDCATPFPTSVIVPAQGANLHGWLHDFVPTIGFTLK